MQKIKKNETVRRPAVVKLAEQLKRQYPRWTDNKCATEAKKRWLATPNAELTGRGEEAEQQNRIMTALRLSDWLELDYYEN